MHIRRLGLLDFRNYPEVEVAIDPGVTVFLGRNGQGKTNLVEAVGYLATLGSHRVPNDGPLVRGGAERAIVRGEVVHAGRQALIELEITPGKANRARLNRSPVSRPRDVLGLLRTVQFAPEDLTLVKGDPEARRRFLDELLIARAPRYAGVRQDYDRVLKQRNTLLKTAGARQGGDAAATATLAAWDEQLARLGAELIAGRMALVEALRPLAAKAYDEVAGTNSSSTSVAGTNSSAISVAGTNSSATSVAGTNGEANPPGGQRAWLEYRSSAERGDDAAGDGAAGDGAAAGGTGQAGDEESGDVDAIAEALTAALHVKRDEELRRGTSLVGPHRDDLLLSLGDFPAKGYASHGESWSFALALRLAAYDLLTEDGGEPVLILDDVFAELDTRRRDRLAARIAGADQVLVTAAVDEDVPERLTSGRCSTFHVQDGKLVSGPESEEVPPADGP